MGQHQKKNYNTIKTGVFLNKEGLPLNIEGLYNNRSIFFILNGPSLNDVDLDLLHRPGILTFGVNNGGAKFKPNLISLQDGSQKFHYNIWEDPTIMKFTNYQNRRKKYFSYKDVPANVKDCPNIIYHKRSSDWTPDEWFNKTTVCWGSKKLSRCSFVAMIHISFLLGFKRIYLLGCDFKMEDKPYFFDERKSKKAMLSNNSTFRRMNILLKESLPLLDSVGLKIYNCTPDSGLTIFPFMQVEDAIEENQLVDNNDTLGLYSRSI